MLLIKPERSDRNRIYGQIASRYGYLSKDQLDQCLADLSMLEEHGRQPWLGEIGSMRGLVTEDERNRIDIASRYYFAREEDKLIARVGVRYGFLDEKVARELLDEQEQRYRKGTGRVPRLLGLLVAKDLMAQGDLLTFLRVLERFAQEDCSREPRVPEEEAVKKRGDEGETEIVRSSRRFQIVDSLIAAMPVSVRLQGLERYRHLPPPPALRGSVLNLSSGGVQAITPDELPAGHPIDVSIHIPIFSQPLEAKGRVRWASHHDGCHRVGIMFTEADQDFRTRLNELAASPFLCRIGQDAFEVC